MPFPDWLLNDVLRDLQRAITADQRLTDAVYNSNPYIGEDGEEYVTFKVYNPEDDPSNYPKDMIVDGTVSPIPKEILP